jgi:ClpP class serine protease
MGEYAARPRRDDCRKVSKEADSDMIDPRFCGVPLAIEPTAARRVLTTARMASFGDQTENTKGDPGYDVVNGVAVIEIGGVLMQKTGLLRSWGGYVTGYDGIRASFLNAVADEKVNGIVFDIDSPGGDVAGCFDLVDTIYNARGNKPIVAICSESAYSAAYAIASAADFISVPRTGGCGSIGVITMLLDQSKALENYGLSVHFVRYGKQKAAESRAQLTGVSDDVLASVQADVDRMGALFVETVARNRGLSKKAVKSQEAACFSGDLGISAGLADAVASPDAAFAAFLADLDAA